MMTSIQLDVAPSETSVLIPERVTDNADATSARRARWRSSLVVGIVAGLVVVVLATLLSHGLASGRKTYFSSGSLTDVDTASQFFEGDLLNIPPSEVHKAYGPQVAQKYAQKLGLAWNPRVEGDDLTSNEKALWPGGVFYYVFSDGLQQQLKDQALEAMQHLSSKVPRVTFVERTTQAAYTNIVPLKFGCYSSDVGRRGNNQQHIWLSEYCTTGYAVHEIMHAMGFWHEQSRPDRDSWIKILWENIMWGKENNFEKRQAWETNDRGSPYDYGSIMHYSKYAYSSNSRKTILRKSWYGPELGNRVAMSFEDEFQMNAAYPSCDMRTNLALRKPAFESSSWDFGAASRAVDGNTNNRWTGHSCSQTSNTDHPWWVVDLGASKDVCSVVLTNRADCCSDRLKNFDIFVTNTRPSAGFRPSGADLCVRVKNTFTGTKSFSCEGVKRGRYVGVQIRERQLLTLCEVQIYGPPPSCKDSTVALNRPAFQSSTALDGVASRGVDGNTNGNYQVGKSCTQTEKEWAPWWVVDLGRSTDICGVVISNQETDSERLRAFDVFVTDTRPSSGFSPWTSELCRRMPETFTFNGTRVVDCIRTMKGRYVGVQLRTKQSLTLCEVQIRTPA